MTTICLQGLEHHKTVHQCHHFFLFFYLVKLNYLNFLDSLFWEGVNDGRYFDLSFYRTFENWRKFKSFFESFVGHEIRISPKFNEKKWVFGPRFEELADPAIVKVGFIFKFVTDFLDIWCLMLNLLSKFQISWNFWWLSVVIVNTRP